MNQQPMWDVTVTVTYGPRQFRQTCHEIEKPSKNSAKRKALDVLRKLFPSARLRTTRVVRNRKAESRREAAGGAR